MAFLASTALSIYGSYQEGEAREASLLEKQKQDNMRANELLERLEINVDAAKRESKRFQGSQIAAAASSGADAFSGANLAALEDTIDSYGMEITNMRRDARFQAGMIRRGAESYGRDAESAKKSSRLKIAGTVASAAVTTAKYYRGKGNKSSSSVKSIYDE